MRSTFRFLLAFFATLSLDLSAATASSSLPGSVPPKIPPVVYPRPQPQQQAPVQPYAPAPRPAVPAMDKPFGMPGVVGLTEGKWIGTDYLRYLSKNITVSIEVLKGDNTPVKADISAIQTAIETLLKTDGLVPRAEVSGGPPLPFLHVLVIIYPVDKDRFVIFSTCRLFEEIQVVRKGFKPSGYWQGITWENQDISLTTTDQLEAQVKSSAEVLVKAFLERYRLYNKEDLKI